MSLLTIKKFKNIFFLARKGLLRDRTDFWNVLELVQKYTPDAVDITTSVKEMTHVK